MISVRPATEEDVSAYFDGEPPEGLRGARLLAYAGESEGKVVGLGGVVYMPHGPVMGFFDIKPEGRKHAVTIHRTARRILATWTLRGHRSLLITVDRSIPKAEEWARRLGFAPLYDDDGVWTWRG